MAGVDGGSPEVTRLFELRSGPARDLARQAGTVAEACHAMAVRFHRGGKLTAASGDPCVVKETQVTTYHILWELVHVFLEQPGVLGPGIVK